MIIKIAGTQEVPNVQKNFIKMKTVAYFIITTLAIGGLFYSLFAMALLATNMILNPFVLGIFASMSAPVGVFVAANFAISAGKKAAKGEMLAVAAASKQLKVIEKANNKAPSTGNAKKAGFNKDSLFFNMASYKKQDADDKSYKPALADPRSDKRINRFGLFSVACGVFFPAAAAAAGACALLSIFLGLELTAICLLGVFFGCSVVLSTEICVMSADLSNMSLENTFYKANAIDPEFFLNTDRSQKLNGQLPDKLDSLKSADLLTHERSILSAINA